MQHALAPAAAAAAKVDCPSTTVCAGRRCTLIMHYKGQVLKLDKKEITNSEACQALALLQHVCETAVNMACLANTTMS